MIAFLLLGDSHIESYLVPGMIVLVAIAFIAVLRVMAGRYKKIPPNAVGIFYGMRYPYRDADGRRQVRGFRVVTGGGALLMPIIGKLNIDEVLRQRDTLERRLIDESTEDLKRLGIQIISLVVQDVHQSPQQEKGENR